MKELLRRKPWEWLKIALVGYSVFPSLWNGSVSNISSMENHIFSESDLSGYDLKAAPKHVAFVMDGNRRWSRKQRLSLNAGHFEGAQGLDRLLRAAITLGIDTVTLFAFSTENWSRPPDEVAGLMSLFETFLVSKRSTLQQEGIRLVVIGDLSKLSISIQKAIDSSCQATKDGQRLTLVLAINYGARDELCRAIKKIVNDCQNKKISSQDIGEELVDRYLDTSGMRDPDLLIRTGSEMRLSNFLLWQISYTEFYVTDVLWPDFGPKDLLGAVITYQQRQRRMGG